MFFVEFNLVLVIIVHVVYSVRFVYAGAIGYIVFFVYNVAFVNIVVSGYNVAHVYKVLVDATTVASCVYIVAIGLILYN